MADGAPGFFVGELGAFLGRTVDEGLHEAGDGREILDAGDGGAEQLGVLLAGDVAADHVADRNLGLDQALEHAAFFLSRELGVDQR